MLLNRNVCLQCCRLHQYITVGRPKFLTRNERQQFTESPKLRTIALTSAEVDPKSVRITTKRKTVSQPNLVFHYVGKTSEEIKSNDKCRVRIIKDGKSILEAPYPSIVFTRVGDTNFIGMLLVFNTYEEAELAEKTLRGN